MPGTAGALLGAGIYLAANAAGLLWLYAPLLAVLGVAGVWAAGRAEKMYGHDASIIVIDEVVGQMVALGFASRTSPEELASGVIPGFLLFRFFDILKPFPIRRLERFPGGLGVMIDDIAAGVYAFLILMVAEPFVLEFL